MSLSKRPGSSPGGPEYGQSGPPAWLIFLTGIALVFAAYYLWLGFQDYVESGGLGILESAEQAELVNTATAERIATQTQSVIIRNPLPTGTPIPECMDFRVNVAVANLRAFPQPDAPILDGLTEGTVVCVLQRTADEDWYLIDRNPRTRTIEEGYIFYNIIEAVNPTPTPSNTVTPAPTVTPMPTDDITLTPTSTPDIATATGSTTAPTPTIAIPNT